MKTINGLSWFRKCLSQRENLFIDKKVQKEKTIHFEWPWLELRDLKVLYVMICEERNLFSILFVDIPIREDEHKRKGRGEKIGGVGGKEIMAQ